MSDPNDKSDGPPKNAPVIIRHPNELTPEQVKMYKDCMYGLFLKAGLPYATVAHLIAYWKPKAEPPQQPIPLQGVIVKRAFFFVANVLLGTFLLAPLCYRELVEKHDLDKRKRAPLPAAPATEKTPTTSLHDDYSYPIDLSSNLSNEAESTFTSEFSPSRILANEDEVTKLTPSTTYEDLRNKHRSSYMRGQIPQPSEDTLKSPYSTSDEKVVENEPSVPKSEPRKFVKRNKYGDEIE